MYGYLVPNYECVGGITNYPQLTVKPLTDSYKNLIDCFSLTGGSPMSYSQSLTKFKNVARSYIFYVDAEYTFRKLLKDATEKVKHDYIK